MFVGHKQRTRKEIKASIRIGKRIDEINKKHKQKQIDAEWLLDIRNWEYPESNKKDNNNKGV